MIPDILNGPSSVLHRHEGSSEQPAGILKTQRDVPACRDLDSVGLGEGLRLVLLTSSRVMLPVQRPYFENHCPTSVLSTQ